MIPKKPFDTYSWRWLSVTPTEGLLDAPVFLGVLRALAKHEGVAPSNEAVAEDLYKVYAETNSTVKLGRTNNRNLIRNSGQYWKGTGLMLPDRGVVRLTEIGRKVACGNITQGDFAALMIQQTVLPNPKTYSPVEVQNWKDAGLEIRPMQLILEVINAIGLRHGVSEGFLTPNELIHVVIPLAGTKEPADKMVNYVMKYRTVGPAAVAGWPDCAQGNNDHRLAREFMLFLANFDVLRRGEPHKDSYGQRFHLDDLFEPNTMTITTAPSILKGDEAAAKALETVQHSNIPSIIERQKAIAQVIARKGQAKFRSNVLGAYANKCLLTGEELPQVLEAAHIIPVGFGGSDDQNNSFCLRVDIHRLYDGQHIRILSNGELVLTDRVISSHNYGALPKSVAIPKFVNPVNVAWRNSYL